LSQGITECQNDRTLSIEPSAARFATDPGDDVYAYSSGLAGPPPRRILQVAQFWGREFSGALLLLEAWRKGIYS
jgi:hypothetical protein